MATTLEALLKLAERQKEKEVKAQEDQKTAKIVQWQDELSGVFTKDVWAALGLNPEDARIDPGMEDRYCLSGSIVVSPWSVPVRFVPNYDFVTAHVNSKSFRLDSGPSHHHGNITTFMRYLADELEQLPFRREHAVKAWRLHLDRATTAEDVHEQRNCIDSIAGVTPELSALLNLECDEAMAAINTARCNHMRVAGEVAALARRWLDEIDVYDETCRVWAEENTARLWKPWMLWRVKYAPARNGSEPLPNDPIGEAMTDTHPTKVRQTLCMRSIWPDGTGVDSFHFGAFFSAFPVTFEQPRTDCPLNYHRTYQHGRYFVNVPALNPDLPTPCMAVAPISFTQYVRDQLTTVSTVTTDPGTLAEMMAEEAVPYVVLATTHLGEEANDEYA